MKEFEKTYISKGSIEEIRTILSDLEVYGELHPLIQTVKQHAADENSYIIKEKPYSWIPITIKYYARVRVIENQIIYKINGLPLTEAKIKYTLEEINDGETSIIYKLELMSKLVGQRILANKMIKAQDQLMKSINISSLTLKSILLRVNS